MNVIATANPEERKQLYKLFLKKRFRWNKILKGMYRAYRIEHNHFDTMWVMKQKLSTEFDGVLCIYLKL